MSKYLNSSCLRVKSGIILGVRKDGRLGAGLRAALLRHRWPENVTSVRSFIRSLVPINYFETRNNPEILELMKMITQIEEGQEFLLHDAVMRIQQSIISRASRRFGGSQSKIGSMLGTSDRTIRRAAKRLA